jgi:hypothetical protein
LGDNSSKRRRGLPTRSRQGSVHSDRREEEVQRTSLDLNGGMKGEDYILPLVDGQDGLFEQSVRTGYRVEAVRSTDRKKNENMPNDKSKHVI